LGKWNTAASRQRYDRAIQEWLARGRFPVNDENNDDGLTVVEVLAAFKRYADDYYRHPGGSPTGEQVSFHAAMRPLKDLYAGTSAADFSPLKLKAVRAKMIEQKWSRPYINQQINRIRHIFKWAVAEELVPSHVLEGLRAVAPLKAGRCSAPEPEPVKPVPLEYVDAVLLHVSSPVAAMIRLQLLTGMRPGEVVVMRGCDIDTTGELWVYRPVAHKTLHHGHLREIYLGPRAQDLVRPFLKLDSRAYLFDPREADAISRLRRHERRRTPLHLGNAPGANRKQNPKRFPGASYSVDSYRRAITRACDIADAWAKAGKIIDNNKIVIPRWHPHQLRHSAATELRKTFGLEAAQVILGHKSLTITQVYAERNVTAAKRVMAEVG
jgi:integrase